MKAAKEWARKWWPHDGPIDDRNISMEEGMASQYKIVQADARAEPLEVLRGIMGFIDDNLVEFTAQPNADDSEGDECTALAYAFEGFCQRAEALLAGEPKRRGKPITIQEARNVAKQTLADIEARRRQEREEETDFLEPEPTEPTAEKVAEATIEYIADTLRIAGEVGENSLAGVAELIRKTDPAPILEKLRAGS